MVREQLKIKKSDALDIISDDHPDFEVKEDVQVGTARWANDYRCIVERIKDNKFFETGYRRGTGDEGESPWEYENNLIDFSEVFPKEKITIVYE